MLVSVLAAGPETIVPAAAGGLGFLIVALRLFQDQSLTLLGAELWAVHNARRGDTITELTRPWLRSTPLPVRVALMVATAAGLGWVWWHYWG